VQATVRPWSIVPISKILLVPFLKGGLSVYGSPGRLGITIGHLVYHEESSEVRVVSNSSTTDVLITRPPLGRGDYTMHADCTGCVDLTRGPDRIQPRLHVFGHIHEGRWCDFRRPHTVCQCFNCNTNYQTANRCTVIDLPHDTSKGHDCRASLSNTSSELPAWLHNAATRHCVAMPKIQKTNR
jgi:hypothetical protein